MYAVIFEVEPQSDRLQDYLDTAARLRPELEKIDGFISIERFKSLSQDGKILSLSFWRDEEAIARWRQHEQHHRAQRTGRDVISGWPRWRAIMACTNEPRRRSRCPLPSLPRTRGRVRVGVRPA